MAASASGGGRRLRAGGAGGASRLGGLPGGAHVVASVGVEAGGLAGGWLVVPVARAVWADWPVEPVVTRRRPTEVCTGSG